MKLFVCKAIYEGKEYKGLVGGAKDMEDFKKKYRYLKILSIKEWEGIL